MLAMNRADQDACRAWQLLMKFFFAQRAHLPCSGAEFDLSPIQCHVLHLLEPGRPLPMSRLADTLSCDASNVTGLVDRLESRGLVRRQPSSHDRRVKVLQLTPTGATPGAAAETDDRRVSPVVAVVSRPAPNAGENARGTPRGEVTKDGFQLAFVGEDSSTPRSGKVTTW